VDSKEIGEVNTRAFYIATNTRVKGSVVEKSEKNSKNAVSGAKTARNWGEDRWRSHCEHGKKQGFRTAQPAH
jgi:hypothetical protein